MDFTAWLNLFQAGLPTPWLTEFQKYCIDLDIKTKVVWRARLLEFVLETRNIIKLSKEAAKEKEKEDSLKNLIFQLEEKFISTEEGGVAVSDSALRERLVNDLVDLRSDVKGADGVKKGDAPLIFLYLVLTLSIFSFRGGHGDGAERGGAAAGGLPGPRGVGPAGEALHAVPQQEPRAPRPRRATLHPLTVTTHRPYSLSNLCIV